MFNLLNINGLEMAAQFATIRSARVAITTKPNVDGVLVEYKGAGEFAYYAEGAMDREISREFAHDVLTQEARA